MTREASSTELEDLIRAEIEGRGPITFARFMELALYEPDLGYYRAREDRPTFAGDYLSAPETHAIFGWTVSRAVEDAWRELASPDPFTLVEFGAGSGTLGLAVFEGLARRGSPLLTALRYAPIELNGNRLEDLRRRFEAAGHGDRLVPLTDREPVDGFVVANEFLDAMPVHRVTVRRGALCELYVTWRDGLVEEPGEPSTPALAERLAGEGVVFREGQIGEIALGIGPWLEEAASRLGRGRLLVIDYGHEAADLYGPRRLAGTLLSYAHHQVRTDPLADAGRQDITAHVDFTAVRRLAAEAGFTEIDFTTQSRFLVAHGLEEELRAVQSSSSTTLAEYTRLRSGVVRLLDPRAMGAFRVLLLER